MQEEGKALEVKAAVNIKQDLLALFKSQIISALVRARIAAFRASLEGLSLSMPKELEVVNFDESEMLHLRFEKMKRGERPNSTQQSVPTWIVFGMFFIHWRLVYNHIIEKYSIYHFILISILALFQIYTIKIVFVLNKKFGL